MKLYKAHIYIDEYNQYYGAGKTKEEAIEEAKESAIDHTDLDPLPHHCLDVSHTNCEWCFEGKPKYLVGGELICEDCWRMDNDIWPPLHNPLQ